MRLNPHEKHSRSIIKSISYRMISMTADTIVAYYFTNNVIETAGIVVFVNFYSTILYYSHERLWSNIKWGRKFNS